MSEVRTSVGRMSITRHAAVSRAVLGNGGVCVKLITCMKHRTRRECARGLTIGQIAVLFAHGGGLRLRVFAAKAGRHAEARCTVGRWERDVLLPVTPICQENSHSIMLQAHRK